MKGDCRMGDGEVGGEVVPVRIPKHGIANGIGPRRQNLLIGILTEVITERHT